MVSLGVLAIDNQQKHRIHIWDRDGNTHQAEPDQLFPSSKTEVENQYQQSIRSIKSHGKKSTVSKELLNPASKFYYYITNRLYNILFCGRQNVGNQ